MSKNMYIFNNISSLLSVYMCTCFIPEKESHFELYKESESLKIQQIVLMNLALDVMQISVPAWVNMFCSTFFRKLQSNSCFNKIQSTYSDINY